jgi:hypothetical protein
MDRSARRKGLTQAQRQDYLFKANRFRHLAKQAAKHAALLPKKGPHLKLVK